MKGKIIRGVGGFYYVHTGDGNTYECRAKGIFRKEGRRPLVGDDVEISVLDAGEKTGNVDELLPRRSELLRPAVANADQALVVFAAASPKPNLGLLDRFLILMRKQQLPVFIAFNKTDLVTEEECGRLADIYRECGSRAFFLSTATGEGIQEIRALLEGRTTVLAGPSGVGKSSLTNVLLQNEHMEVGAVSRKIDRGRHTTRHTELLVLPENAGQTQSVGRASYLLDTPGFSSLWLKDVDFEELKDCFDEFAPYAQDCRFLGCMHLREPDCAVKNAVAEGKIHPARYESYALLAEELKNRKKY